MERFKLIINITKNDFKKILIVVAGVVVALFVYLNRNGFMNGINSIHYDVRFSEGSVIGTWLWKGPTMLSKQEVVKLLNQAKDQGINEIYLEIGEYIDYEELADKSESEKKLRSFEEQLKYFIENAGQRGIKVEALSGSPKWIEDSHEYIPLRIIDYVYDFNSRNDFKFSGVHFDIEPWGAAKPTEQTLSKYLKLIEKLTLKNDSFKASKITLALDIPFWLDDQTAVTKIDLMGKKVMPYEHIFNLMHNSEKIVILAYRTTTSGNNGINSVIKNELTYAQENTPEVKVLVALESVKNEEPSISYYGRSKNKLLEDLNRVYDEYRDLKILKGFAVHDLENYLGMAN